MLIPKHTCWTEEFDKRRKRCTAMVERWELYIANRHSWVSIKCFCEIPLFWFGLYTVVVGKWTPFFLQNYHLHQPLFFFYCYSHSDSNSPRNSKFLELNIHFLIHLRLTKINLSLLSVHFFKRQSIYAHWWKVFFPTDMCWNLSNHPFLFYLGLFIINKC